MGSKRQNSSKFNMLLVVLLTFLIGCSGSGGPTPAPSSSTTIEVISSISETASNTQGIVATQGGSVTFDEAAIEFPAAALPADAQIKISKVTVSESEQDSSLIDMTHAYVISTTSSARTINLASSATIKFHIDPTAFDETTIRMAVWDGYEWEEVPCSYDSALKVVSSTLEAIMPFGTRIYLANPDAATISNPRMREGGTHIISEFVAIKVVGETRSTVMSTSTPSGRYVAQSDDTTSAGRAVFIKSPKGKFTVNYYQVKDTVQAAALKQKANDIAVYMDNAYTQLVTGMGLREPDVTTKAGYGSTWPVKLRPMKGVHGTANPGTWEIEINIDDEPGDGLAHTCHHEFTHLTQFKTLFDANNDVRDSWDWFNEQMADAVGYYAQKGRGTIYSLADASMGYFYMRLDADKDTLPDKNDGYEYRHYPFIAYLLAVYKETGFKKFYETWYAYTGSQINLTTIDRAASTTGALGKNITGRDGIFWDFYRDYFISGIVFNKDKFPNLPSRSSGSSSAPSPFEIMDNNKGKQGVTLVEVQPKIAYQNEFTIQRLAGQVALLRFTGSSGTPMNLSVSVSSAPGQSAGRIQLNAFKRVNGVLQSTGDVADVSDGATATKVYTGVGSDITDIYLLMVNTTGKADDYKVSVVVTEK